ncbi:MAG: hypothetical protein ABIQ86_10350 [Steroidobacteraceae bacterium]
MSSNLREQPAEPAVYERAFLRTVLRLRGVQTPPTERELNEARDALRLYQVGTAKALPANASSSYGRLKGRLAEPVAVEHAFMYVTFHSFLPPNAGQLKALNDWLAAKKLP